MHAIKTIGILLIACLAPVFSRASAQTNNVARLAIVSESSNTSAAADMLAVELSHHKSLQLLERNQVEKVYREQALSAGNRNFLKLGRILGADGLLLIGTARQGKNQVLFVRLIAVKPGVVLTTETSHWPLKDVSEWSKFLAGKLNVYFPKLTLMPKNAVPISVVNLRSAISSNEAKETEQQLKWLTVQRLSAEPQFFVLEREKMQLLGNEKELNLDNSAFWDGRYLLAGVVDQNGYSKRVITINASLSPPKGGAPLRFEVSGSRTNLTDVVNQLVAKVTALLKISPTVKEWSAHNEAQQYFNEAIWALRWDELSEAQAAANSAWALGKQDMECAQLRIRSYLYELPDVLPSNIEHYEKRPSYHFVHINDTPNPKNCDTALHILRCYYDFSRNSPEGQPKMFIGGKRWNNRRDSEWYRLGIESLVAASKVLQHFYFCPESQAAISEKLAELRALTRTVAQMISQSPMVHDSYYVGDRIATHDELVHTMQENPNLFACEVKWGCFWQERPEDTIALYRKLMGSPAFCYIHGALWNRDALHPRLVAWNKNDKKHTADLWRNFVGELNTSTNVLLQMEAKALAKVDAPNKEQAKAAETAWWNIVRSHREELVANKVELFYLGWGFAYNKETRAMDFEYWQKTVPAAKMAATFLKQKEYLASFSPFTFGSFSKLFNSQNYTKTQAAELKPLIVTYKSNLLAHASSGGLVQVQRDVGNIEIFLESHVDAVLSSPPKVPEKSVQSHQSQPPPVAAIRPVAVRKRVLKPASNSKPQTITNIVLVKKFIPIPIQELPGKQIASLAIFAHHWYEGKLVLDLNYQSCVYSHDISGHWTGTRTATRPAIAVLDPKTEHWQVVSCPETDFRSVNFFYSHTALWQGHLFTSNNKRIKEYNHQTHKWQSLETPDIGNCELFVVNGLLYAANNIMIFEITDGGKSIRILASNRRQPPVSLLDREDLGTPTLFSGPNHSLRVSTRNKIFTFQGDDWHQNFAAPRFSYAPVVSQDGVLFVTDGFNYAPRISRLMTDSNSVEYCLGQNSAPGLHASFSNHNANTDVPIWKLPAGLRLFRLPAAMHQSDLFLLVDHSRTEDIVNEQKHLIVGSKVLPQNGYHAELLCYTPNLRLPEKLYLKFDTRKGQPPVTGTKRYSLMHPEKLPEWMLFTTNLLFFGLERPDSLMPASSFHPKSYFKVGVWVLPLAQISPGLARQKQARMEEKAASKKAWQAMVAKYDRNRNGVIDPEESEEVMDVTSYIESALDRFDTNHNGWLDPVELARFDVNHNKKLDPKEEAGIDITLHLLATRMVEKFGNVNTHEIDRFGFNNLVNSYPRQTTSSSMPYAPFPDDNHDGGVDSSELAKFLRRFLWKQVRQYNLLRSPRIFRSGNGSSDRSQSFKEAVELYWQNPNGNRRRLDQPPFHFPPAHFPVKFPGRRNISP